MPVGWRSRGYATGCSTNARIRGPGHRGAWRRWHTPLGRSRVWIDPPGLRVDRNQQRVSSALRSNSRWSCGGGSGNGWSVGEISLSQEQTFGLYDWWHTTNSGTSGYLRYNGTVGRWAGTLAARTPAAAFSDFCRARRNRAFGHRQSDSTSFPRGADAGLWVEFDAKADRSIHVPMAPGLMRRVGIR